MEHKLNIVEGEISLLLIPNEQYGKWIVDIAKHLSKLNKTVLYVSVNKPAKTLAAKLSKAGINVKNFFFLDTISASISSTEPLSNCIHISSGSALTELSIAIQKCLQLKKFDAVLFDSLSTLLIYNPNDVASHFIHNNVNQLRNANVTAVFTALEGDSKSQLLKDVNMFVDSVKHCR